MASIQVGNIPDELYERLRKHARDGNCSLRALVVAGIERELKHREWKQRWAQLPETDMGIAAADLIAEERTLRDAEME